jgi:hypothetical protein
VTQHFHFHFHSHSHSRLMTSTSTLDSDFEWMSLCVVSRSAAMLSECLRPTQIGTSALSGISSDAIPPENSKRELRDRVRAYRHISLFPDRLLSGNHRGTSGTSPRLLINPTHSSWHESLTPARVEAGRSQQSFRCRDYTRNSNKQKQNGSLTSVRVAQIR